MPRYRRVYHKPEPAPEITVERKVTIERKVSRPSAAKATKLTKVSRQSVARTVEDVPRRSPQRKSSDE